MLSNLRRGRAFYATLWALFIPQFFQNLITQSLSLADTFMVGLLGESELAAVTLANAPFFVVMLMGFGLQSGAGVLIAQYWGKGDTHTISRVIGVCTYFSFGVTLLVALFSVFCTDIMTGLLTSDPVLAAIAGRYIKVVAFAFLFNSLSGVAIGAHRSIGNPKMGLIIFSISMLINTFLNWVMIFGKLGFPALGVEGAALATLISRVVEFVISAIYLFRSKKFRPRLELILKPGREITRDFIKYASPVVLNETFWSLGTSIYPIIMGHMVESTAVVAAYTIAGNVDRFCTMGVFAIANASAVIVGAEVGKGEPDNAYHVGAALNIISVGFGAVMLGVLFLALHTLIEPYLYGVFELSDASRAYATTMITIMAIALPVRAFNTTNIVGVLRGGGDVKAAAILDLTAMYLLAVPMAALSALVFNWSVAVMYLFIMSDEFIKFFLGLRRFITRRWIINVTREIPA